MIEFKIVATADKSQQSTYQHLGLQLVFGREQGDMILDDSGLSEMQLRIFFLGSQAMVENLDPSVEVRLNGRALSEPSPLKARDNITMSRTTIQFSQLDTQPQEPPPPYEYPQAITRLAQGTKEKAILDALDQLLKKTLEAAPPGAPKTEGGPPPLPGSGPPSPPGGKPPPPPGGRSGGPPPLPPGRK